MDLLADRLQTQSPLVLGTIPALPLIAIAGAVGKTSTGWRLVEYLEMDGIETGAWLTGGVYVGGQHRNDELHAWELATYAARAREIGILIQEIPSVLAANLPEQSVWMALLTAICGSDNVCKREASTGREIDAVGSVLSAVHPQGRIVATADDLMVVHAVTNVDQDVIYYALNGSNPVIQAHIELGGDAVWIEGDWVYVHLNGRTLPVVPVEVLPETLEGTLIYQVQNALGAIACYVAISKDHASTQHMLKILSEQAPSPHPAGTQVRQDAGATSILDRPRSLSSLKQLVRGVRSFGFRRIILRVGSLSEFTGTDIREAARVLGALGGIALIPASIKGSERAAHINEGLMASENPPAIIYRQDSEATIDRVLSMLGNEDVALYLYDEAFP